MIYLIRLTDNLNRIMLLTERNGTERNGTERNGTERNGIIAPFCVLLKPGA